MQKPRPCFEPQPCPLANRSNGFSKPEGTGALGVAIIGEALGDNEYKDGQPFRPYAEAGSALQTAIRIAQSELQRPAVQRDGFLLWNLCACNPPGNKLFGESYEAEAIQHCSVYFNYVLNGFVERNPNRRCLLACGNLPLKYLTGVTGRPSERQSVSDLRGYVLQSQWGWVVPTYHPSFVRRGNLQLMPCLVADIKRALSISGGQYTTFVNGPDWEQPDYDIAPSTETAWSYCRYVQENKNLILAVDIETSSSRYFDEDQYNEGEVEYQLGEEIVLVQFSTRKGHGIALNPKSHEAVIKALLETENVKVGHNWWLFDAPRVQQRGWKVNGPVHDSMVAFRKYRPELPSGLQAVAGWAGFPFPWKHLYDKQLEWYGCADVDSLHWIMEWLIPQMQATGTWKHYFDHCFRYRYEVLSPAEERGIPVDEGERQALDTRLRERRTEEDKALQEAIPAEVKQIKPRRKVKYLNEQGKEDSVISFGYRTTPKTLKQLECEYNLTPAEDREPWAKTVHDRLGLVLRETPDVNFGSITVELKSGKTRDKPVRPKKGEILPGRVYHEKRWGKIEEFRASPKQLKTYILWKRRQLASEEK